MMSPRIAKQRGGSVGSLAWQEAADGLDAGTYRVRRLTLPSEYRWQLEIIRRGLGWQEEPAVSLHRTRRGAIASATMYERHRVRRVRLQIHLGLFATSAISTWVIASLSTDPGLSGFLVWIALFGVGIKSLANAFCALDLSTDIERDPNRLLTIERWIRVDSLIPPRGNRFNDPAAPDEVKIRTLDPLG